MLSVFYNEFIQQDVYRIIILDETMSVELNKQTLPNNDKHNLHSGR